MKGRLLTRVIKYPWLKLVTFGMIVRILKSLEFNHLCNMNDVHMLFYKRSIGWKHLRCIGLISQMDCTCWGELRKRHQNSVLNRFCCLKTSPLLTFINFSYFFYSLGVVFCWFFMCLLMSALFFVCSHIYSRGGPSTYVYCVVCYHMIAAPCVRSGGCVFFTLDVDSEHP